MGNLQAEETNQCELLGPFGVFIQFVLGCLCLSSLIFKRHIERPKRSVRIWLLDVSKQCVGVLLLHFLNLFCSVLISKENDEDACVWYLNNILIDSTLGLLYQYTFIRVLEIIARKLRIETLVSGCYYSYDSEDFTDENIDYGIWFAQMGIWCLISSMAKFINYIILISGTRFFRKMGEAILGSFQDKPKLELVFVMIIMPLITSLFQYWITDNFLKESDESRIERLGRGKDKLANVGPESYKGNTEQIDKQMNLMCCYDGGNMDKDRKNFK